ncbi:MAG TPA: succinate dehydrogenase, cytochrome b556 subunit [Gordonia sp. (in: high G+C Gram-positive bacteria)]|uniref:succinate dehydrogenase, cytochrome b556 subunit n=1 Tax=unclassified Gordonia (in: high G+C Gram-positive bacteria) TaxID=2657482 RepID=UPI000FA5C239|nr:MULTISPECIES: succinate dehydrogenase, cytochrome b556 subunit [unclassified Gordonia (in: high G+C Gram-positive bacteria)]RUP37071.1 MAG: succinate dehydrogenase, cytochrome b556 subunit [Gordonia sp. (in: high G+C Gram-positive bacteria)]HNP55435.1 succinate dehydrogenase, cytochrome b556 subunit [Gordonia sp. (in: high G+C Gram-positive bacteria)]HRC50148.1 succinate dehydrogenase, cytochrome b556 subunit [Gordonia sp. (in: high G+C Gram-positive bacteria)]
MSTPTEAPAPVRKVSVYRGDPGMWAWVLHRITGVTIFFFLFVHVLDTAVIRINAEEYDAIINTYKTPIIGLMEIALVFCVLFHAFNGVRVILIDFWSKGPRYQRQMLWVVVGLFIIVFGAAAIRLLQLILTHAFH